VVVHEVVTPLATKLEMPGESALVDRVTFFRLSLELVVTAS
jgi:hypothetical protein